MAPPSPHDSWPVTKSAFADFRLHQPAPPPRPTTDGTPLNHGGMIGGWGGERPKIAKRTLDQAQKKGARGESVLTPSSRVITRNTRDCLKCARTDGILSPIRSPPGTNHKYPIPRSRGCDDRHSVYEVFTGGACNTSLGGEPISKYCVVPGLTRGLPERPMGRMSRVTPGTSQLRLMGRYLGNFAFDDAPKNAPGIAHTRTCWHEVAAGQESFQPSGLQILM